MKKAERSDFSDMIQLGETVLSALLGAGKEWRRHAQDSKESLARKMDLVTREEFDVAFAMIKKARAMQENLDKRITRLEKERRVSTPQKRTTKKQIRPKK